MMLIVFACLALLAPIPVNSDQRIQDSRLNRNSSKIELYIIRTFDWIGNRALEVIDEFILDEKNGRSRFVEGRKHKYKKIKLGKYIFPLLIGIFLVKSMMIPLILKALAILSGKAVLLSFLSLILSAIIGLKQMSMSHQHEAHKKVDLVPLTKYRRKDYANEEEPMDEGPYVYYAEKQNKRKR